MYRTSFIRNPLVPHIFIRNPDVPHIFHWNPIVPHILTLQGSTLFCVEMYIFSGIRAGGLAGPSCGFPLNLTKFMWISIVPHKFHVDFH